MRPANLGIINSGSIGGDASVELDLRRIGDDVRVRASGSVVNVKGRMRRVRQRVSGGTALPESARAELEEVVAELAGRLEGVARRMPSETDRVLVALETLSRELARRKPDRSILDAAWAGLKKALGLLGDALPEVVGLSKKLAALIALLPI